MKFHLYVVSVFNFAFQNLIRKCILDSALDCAAKRTGTVFVVRTFICNKIFHCICYSKLNIHLLCASFLQCLKKQSYDLTDIFFI